MHYWRHFNNDDFNILELNIFAICVAHCFWESVAIKMLLEAPLSQFVYHFKPKGMIGNFLIPLNKLIEKHPEAYNEHIKKYKGREHILQESRTSPFSLLLLKHSSRRIST